MSDLISRRQIHDYIQSQINPYGKPFKGTAYELGLKIMDYITNMSTVEPVRGEWMFTPTFNEYECSNCKSMISLSDDANAHPNFCPNCGCDMRGEKND